MSQAFLGDDRSRIGVGHTSISNDRVRAGLPDDPIHQVSEAVQSVLNRNRPRSPERKDADCHVFAGTLLSVRQAEALPPGTRAVQTASGVVITPLARDFLKRRGITIRVGNQADTRKAGAQSGEWGFAIESELGTVSALRRALLEDVRPWSEAAEELTTVTEWLVAATGRGALSG